VFELAIIRPLSDRHRPQILAHLMRLPPHDRYLRFGYQASDEQVERYVQGLNFTRDELHGIFDHELSLVGVSHLALPPPGPTQAMLGGPPAEAGRCAEFGVSVLPEMRGQRLGSRLYAHAVRSARVHGLDQLFIHALSENTAMLRIARRHGARVERMGSESEAYLCLPPADMNTRVQHLVETQLALLDYGMKAKNLQWRDLLAIVQETRDTLRANRHRCAA
jgi:GNAT superfamily N-acetyltransferase